MPNYAQQSRPFEYRVVRCDRYFVGIIKMAVNFRTKHLGMVMILGLGE